MQKKTVAVLFGGQSSEHEVSCTSAAMVISHMNSERYFIIPVGITKKGRWLIYNGPVHHIQNGDWEKYATPAVLSPDATHRCLLKIVGSKVKEIPIDVVFPVLHGACGEDGTVQGLLELSRLPYVGCGVLASSVSMDKVFTKIIARNAGIAQADYLALTRHDLKEPEDWLTRIEQALGYPCFIKPANAGSSVGISKAHNRDELMAGLLQAAEHDRKLLVEKAVIGREIECAVLGNENPRATGVGEILSAAEFYDYEAKYQNAASKTVIPADLPAKTVEEIQRLAVAVFRAVDGTGLARVDFFVEEGTGRVLFNELNTLPGFTPVSMYPMLWEAQGLKKTALIDELLELAFTREANSKPKED